MSSGEKQRTREEVAAIEVGHTDVTRGQSRVLAVLLLLLVFAVPAVEFVCAPPRPNAPRAARVENPAGTRSAGASPVSRLLQANRALLGSIHRTETALKDDALLTKTLVPPAQQALTQFLGAGNEKAYPGRDGWLFFRPDVDTVTRPGFLEDKVLAARAQSGSEWQAAPQPDPVLAILQFQRDLAERGIRLVVVPAPSKATIHPEKFSARGGDAAEPVQNASFAEFRRELENPALFFARYERFLRPYRAVSPEKARRLWVGPLRDAVAELESARETLQKDRVLWFDPAPQLVGEKIRTGHPQYLATDTHWTPEAAGLVARELAAFLRERVALPPVPAPNVLRSPVPVTNLGDVAVLLRLPAGQALFPSETVTTQQVRAVKAEGQTLWRPDPGADVLLLGDSFSNVYSLGAMGWGEAAGLAEQLSVELGRPVDAIVRNDSGARATREMLSRELARGRDRLAGKRVVIWEFAARELSFGDWTVRDAPMRLGAPRESRFVSVGEGQTPVVTGTVREITPAPRPETVPYEDHVVYAHLADVQAADGSPLRGNEALVALLSMRKKVWTPAARLRPGDTVRLRLRDYESVNREHKIESINSTELAGEVALETPCWGEEPDLSTADRFAGRVTADRTAGATGRVGAGSVALVVLAVLVAAAGVVRIAEVREEG